MMSLDRIQRIASELVRQSYPAFKVVAATNGEGATDYVEIIFLDDNDAVAPRRVVVGVARSDGESVIRDRLQTGLRDGVAAHDWKADRPAGVRVNEGPRASERIDAIA